MSRFAELGQRMKAAAEAGTPSLSSGPDGNEQKDMTMTDTVDTNSNDYKAGMEAARKAANDRVNAVIASEHYAGREKLAATLLNSDMNAESIVAALAAAPAPAKTGSETVTDPKAEQEERDKDLMRANLQKGNPDLGEDNEDEAAQTAKAKAENYGWDKIHARVEEQRNAQA